MENFEFSKKLLQDLKDIIVNKILAKIRIHEEKHNRKSKWSRFLAARTRIYDKFQKDERFSLASILEICVHEADEKILISGLGQNPWVLRKF